MTLQIASNELITRSERPETPLGVASEAITPDRPWIHPPGAKFGLRPELTPAEERPLRHLVHDLEHEVESYRTHLRQTLDDIFFSLEQYKLAYGSLAERVQDHVDVIELKRNRIEAAEGRAVTKERKRVEREAAAEARRTGAGPDPEPEGADIVALEASSGPELTRRFENGEIEREAAEALLLGEG